MANSSKATRSSASKPSQSKKPQLKVAPARKAPARSVPAAKAAAGRAAPSAGKAGKSGQVVPLRARAATTKTTNKKAASSPAVRPGRAKPPVAKPAAVKAPAVQPPAVLASSPLLVALRAEEQRAVRQALAGEATLLASSPRARDAAIFAAAASVARRPVLVVSPLAAELVEHAALLPGLDVAAFGTFVSPETAAASKRRLARGGPLLVVVEPAQLFDAALRQVVAQCPLALLGIAAAHACSEHAHELSPAYLSIKDALPAFAAPVLATCTATSARVVEHTAEAIGAKPSAVITAGSPELARSAQVVRSTERKNALFAAVLAFGAPGVVLTATPQEADAVFAELSARQVPCVRAHAGMTPAERTASLRRFTDAHEQLVLVTQSPHANASGLAGCPETSYCLGSVSPRPDLGFVVHYQAPLSPEQLFEDLAWLSAGKSSLVLADSSDAALIQALLAQQRIKPAAVEAMAQVLSQLADGRAAPSDTLALRAGTSRRSAERVLGAFADRNLVVRDGAQISRQIAPEELVAEGRVLSARFAALRAADATRAEQVARYVTSRHGTAPVSPAAEVPVPRYVRA